MAAPTLRIFTALSNKRKATYQALIFDLGNVVFHCSWEAAYGYWTELSGQSIANIITKFEAEYELHDAFEKAIINPKKMWEHVSLLLDYPLSEAEFEKGWNSLYGDLCGEINTLLPLLKKNYRLVALTNTNALHAQVWPNIYKDSLQHFEKVFSSHEMHCRKPEAKAYHIVMDYLHLSPAELLFLDDNLINVEAAKRLGIDSILVRSYEQMIDELKDKGLTV